MKKNNIFPKLLGLLALFYIAFATVSCQDDDISGLDDLVISLQDQIQDTAYFGTKFKVGVIANQADVISMSLSPEANPAEKAYDTTIINQNNRYIFSKEILIPADGSWSGNYILKVTSGSVEKTHNVFFMEAPGFPALYVPGAHQGWDPATAPTIVSVKSDDVYEGYLYFANANNEFKLTSDPNWDNTNYGNGGDGTLITDADAGNLTTAEAGYYLVEADLNENTWSATKTDWGIIGDATAGGWDSDQDMTYDPDEKVWKATIALSVGAMKFRANDAWDINYGDAGGDGTLDFNSDNIVIADAGNYEVTLDLSTPGKYTYTLTKQ